MHAMSLSPDFVFASIGFYETYNAMEKKDILNELDRKAYLQLSLNFQNFCLANLTRHKAIIRSAKLDNETPGDNYRAGFIDCLEQK